jgi:gluconate kinase
MKPAMLDSQFAALERPQPGEADILTIPIDSDIDTIVMQAMARIAAYWGIDGVRLTAVPLSRQ